MEALLIVYFIYLVLFGLVSYAIVFHLTRYRMEGDKSGQILALYLILTGIIVVSSILLIRPF